MFKSVSTLLGKRAGTSCLHIGRHACTYTLIEYALSFYEFILRILQREL